MNVRSATLTLQPVATQEAALARADAAYRVVARMHASAPAFVRISHLLLMRLQCESFPHEAAAVREQTATESLLATLRTMVNVGEAPAVPEARLFVGEASNIVAARKTFRPSKTAWLTNHLAQPEAVACDIVVDSLYTAALGRAHLRHGERPRGQMRVEPFTSLRNPRSGGVLVTAAPGPRVLQSLVTGSVPSARILLYPWEVGTYNSARGYLLACAREAGVSWPTLPEATEVEFDMHGDSAPQLLARPRGVVEDERDATPDATEPDEIRAVEDETQGEATVVVTTSKARHAFPVRRTVVVEREAVLDIPVAEIRVGDVLVNYVGGNAPSASELVARICATNAAMDQTRALSAAWRRLLREHWGRERTTIAELHRRFQPGVEYPQFRVWLLEGDPVTPREDNLVRIMATLGHPEPYARAIYRAGVDHKNDRARIFKHIFALARGRLGDLFSPLDKGEVVDPDSHISIEDLLAVVSLERVTQVEHYAR